jgi:hypothetical protein
LEGEDEEDSSEIPDDFFVVSNGGTLPIEMFEIHNLLKWRATPAEFREHILNNDELQNTAKPSADHSRLQIGCFNVMLTSEQQL